MRSSWITSTVSCPTFLLCNATHVITKLWSHHHDKGGTFNSVRLIICPIHICTYIRTCIVFYWIHLTASGQPLTSRNSLWKVRALQGHFCRSQLNVLVSISKQYRATRIKQLKMSSESLPPSQYLLYSGLLLWFLPPREERKWEVVFILKWKWVWCRNKYSTCKLHNYYPLAKSGMRATTTVVCLCAAPLSSSVIQTEHACWLGLPHDGLHSSRYSVLTKYFWWKTGESCGK